MEAKKVVMGRIYLSFFILTLMGLAILVQIIRIQFVDGDRLKALAASRTLAYRDIEASRGNIFSSDGSLLATSIPIYDLRMDTHSDAMTKELFDRNIDSLSRCLSDLFKDKSWLDYKYELREARSNGSRYFLLKRDISYPELQKVKSFPLFRLGQYKGGLIVEQKNSRQLPFDLLAKRTIGTPRSVKPVGIEASFDKELTGVKGQRLAQLISGNEWMPVNDKDVIEPKDGNDVISTIDLNIQDVAEHSLEQHLREHDADHGCAILMEVSTGEIKAIANLSRTVTGDYEEDFNYAIAEATEPGSTFKMASMLAALEDELVDLTDTVYVGNGKTFYYGRPMEDAHAPKASKLSMAQAFESSSNVGISRLIIQRYLKQPEKFVSRLQSFGLNNSLGLQIEGEGEPRIKNVSDKDWWAGSLAWMSIGYESKLTPLQILSFYNAIANNGRMVRPKIVREIQMHGKVIKSFPTEIIRDSIASPRALAKAKILLEGVVKNGTASILKTSPYKIAGKTGTAQIARSRFGYDKGHSTYQASFAGYFPADNPRYSCIVVVYAPSNNVYYGGAVAAPIFKEISDKVYSNHLDMHDSELKNDTVLNLLPVAKAAQQKDLKLILAQLDLPVGPTNPEAIWASTKSNDGKIVMSERKQFHGGVPNVIGMGLKDALYILENSGLTVRITGKGQVVRQSLDTGTKFQRGQVIYIELG